MTTKNPLAIKVPSFIRDVLFICVALSIINPIKITSIIFKYLDIFSISIFIHGTLTVTMKTPTKNPTAIKIGNRIRQARKMAGFDTAAQLNEHLTDWSASRLGNYEAGISTPSPDDIERIAQLTSASPCWITFGIGPIRSSMRDIQAIRHQNLGYLVAHAKTANKVKSLITTLGLSKPKLDEHLDNPFINITDRLARRCEKFLTKPNGWMDEQHVEADPVCAAFPEDMREVMTIYSNLAPHEREKFLRIARIFGDTHELN